MHLPASTFNSLHAKLVIELSFLGIADDLVGRLDLFELFNISVRPVGMEFERESFIGLPDFLLGTVFVKPHVLVE